MNITKTSLLVLALAMLCLSPGCTILGLYRTKIIGVYDTQDAAESPAGGRVAAYSLDDDGTQTPVSGQIGAGKTKKEGSFVLYFFQEIKNLIIEITQNGQTTKCTITAVPQAAQLAASLSAAAGKTAADNASDNKTQYAIVNPETDVATDLLLQEVGEGAPPDQVNQYDIDEVIDAGIASEIRGNAALHDCVIAHIYKARKLSRLLFLDILEDGNVGQDVVSDAGGKITGALAKIEAVRKGYIKKIFGVKKSGGGSDQIEAQIEALLSQQQQKVLEILAAAGIPPQLYMKAGLIAETEFERAIKSAAENCDFPATLRYRLIKRALVREAQSNALQTKTVLKKVFNYDNASKIDAALATFLAAMKQLPDNTDNREAIRTSIVAFHGALLNEVLAAVDDSIVPDAAILNVCKAIGAARPGLEADLQAAQNSADIKSAFESFYATIRPTIVSEFAISSADPAALTVQKKALADLLFTLGV